LLQKPDYVGIEGYFSLQWSLDVYVLYVPQPIQGSRLLDFEQQMARCQQAFSSIQVFPYRLKALQAIEVKKEK
jgi:hypothetical protein